MIGGVTRQVGDDSVTFRMTTRAMMAIEDHFDKGLLDVMQGMEKGFRVSDLAFIVSQCAADGDGVDMARARIIMDHLGVTSAGDLLGEVAEAAFPEAKEPTAKKPKRAARSK